MKLKIGNSFFSRSRTILVAAAFLSLAACGDDLRLPDDPTNEQVAESPSTSPDKPATETPSVEDAEKAAILSKYDYVDPNHIVPTKSLTDAILYYHHNKAKIDNPNYLSIINFAQSSKEKRFYIIDMKSGSVWAIHTSHGKGSDSNHDGYAEKFSNVSGSNASSLGYYLTAETYNGSNGYSLRLDGLSSTNSRARSRAIVIHGASYVQESNVIQGRSWGCPAVATDIRTKVINMLKGGSLIYAVVDKGGTGPITVPAPTPSPTPTNPPTSGAYQMYSLAWETSSKPERKNWSQYLMKLVLEDWNSLLKGTSDITSFCPTYYSLNNNERANVWAQLFVGMARYESNYNPTSRMHETTMGTDYVTKKPVYSEGLLQLSYQDIGGYSFCKFDWSKDKYLSSTDPKKTILDPYINLHCGVGIMAKQIARKGAIKVGSGAYWAVLKTSSSSNKISSITSMVKSLPICK
ncbi:murein L,D-transpeptidase catalytic domain family protein [Bdellovibrio sp. 22V]|uniref:murein L,D-transpeptidase catalytic domain family protein n=1 Tax=Bdellovibrio TaxID=958 RepID=UPI002542907E|nr:murein L,D-transpeptidase catalytic domain family protein [Bdellovibrio sp. 22V]WII72068.1 murein L,D-transpeptidase catalytic domain family protein [Bdellovibrio sp. 22V]